MKPLPLTSTIVTCLLALAALSVPASLRADNDAQAQQLSRELSSLRQAAEQAVRESDKAAQQAASELAAAKSVNAEARMILADSEKAVADAEARVKAAQENARAVADVRNSIGQADDSVKRQLNPPKKADPAKKPDAKNSKEKNIAQVVKTQKTTPANRPE